MSLQALAMGMMTEYYHYIFTTLVSKLALLFLNTILFLQQYLGLFVFFSIFAALFALLFAVSQVTIQFIMTQTIMLLSFLLSEAL